ncbi:MAG TPA: hypothetical protein VF828_00855 [Patescibacteria group bacterium]
MNNADGKDKVPWYKENPLARNFRLQEEKRRKFSGEDTGHETLKTTKNDSTAIFDEIERIANLDSSQYSHENIENIFNIYLGISRSFGGKRFYSFGADKAAFTIQRNAEESGVAMSVNSFRKGMEGTMSMQIENHDSGDVEVIIRDDVNEYRITEQEPGKMSYLAKSRKTNESLPSAKEQFTEKFRKAVTMFNSGLSQETGIQRNG